MCNEYGYIRLLVPGEKRIFAVFVTRIRESIRYPHVNLRIQFDRNRALG
jgi:hypothetical protein